MRFWRHTRLTGEGRNGIVYILFSVIPRKRVDAFKDVVDKVAPKAFVTVEEARDTRRGHLPHIGKLK